MRAGRTAAVLVCVLGIVLGVYFVYVGTERDDLSTSPWTAAAVAYVVTGVVGLVLRFGIPRIRGSETGSWILSICVAIAIAGIWAVAYYAGLGFGAT